MFIVYIVDTHTPLLTRFIAHVTVSVQALSPASIQFTITGMIVKGWPLRTYRGSAHRQNELNGIYFLWRVKCNGKVLKHMSEASDCALALYHLNDMGWEELNKGFVPLSFFSFFFNLLRFEGLKEKSLG